MTSNKEECLKALNYFYEEVSIDEYNTKLDDKNYQILEKLIGEHFENPPLKFEELEVGMLVWDNKRKEWCVLAAFWKDALNRYYVSGFSDSPFEENRFYRKQVE